MSLRFLALCSLSLIGTVCFSTVIHADEAAAQVASHPVVPAFERFHDQKTPLSLSPGMLLLGELNCTSCHTAGPAVASMVTVKQAPILTDVSKRVRPQYLVDYLTQPQSLKAGTTMPLLLHGLDDADRRDAAISLAAYLSQTGQLVDAAVENKRIKNGDKLFHETGCTACHAPQNGTIPDGLVSVPLGDLSLKYTVPALHEFLKNPLHTRPSARMPAPNLNDNEARDVANFLLRKLSGVSVVARADLPKIPYKYYEGDWQDIPDFSKLKPKATGVGPAFDLGLRKQNDKFGFVFNAVFLTGQNGEYTFELSSDDGSELLVDGKRVVLNGGIHPATPKTGRVKLNEGIHDVEVRYFEAGGEEVLSIKFGYPGEPLQPFAPLAFADRLTLQKSMKYETVPDKEPDKPKSVLEQLSDPARISEGDRLFGSLGCANCHELKTDNKLVVSSLVAKPLADLDENTGCLAKEPSGKVPDYSLSAVQIAALKTAIGDAQHTTEAPRWSPEQQISVSMLRNNCYACHQRNEIGGVEEIRNDFFKTTQQEMGDEGRIPPSLDGVGAKLKDTYQQKIFREGANDRPYMLTRMPKFGQKNVGDLQKLWGETDKLEPIEIPEINLVDRRIRSEGRSMCGDQVFGCVKCHTFNGKAALGIQSIDLTVMTQRLNHNWFHQYLVRPSKFRRGTRMPTAWPGGYSTLRDVLDGDTHKQIEAIWQYLEQGKNARVPSGLNRQAIVLAADKNAVIYRNFIQGAGPRAIGVAYPEGVNIAWDANELRLALAWQGRFIDASKHWVGRGQGNQDPLGDQILKWPSGPSVAALESVNAAWPAQSPRETGYRFRGYKVTADNRPQFRYTLGDGLTIHDDITATAGKPFGQLVRTVTAEAKAGYAGPLSFYFRPMVGKTIVKQDDGSYLINNDYRIRLESDAEPVIVTVNGQQELRVPLKFKDDKAGVVQRVVW